MIFKDARSVSFYPLIGHKSKQYAQYTKQINIAKKIAKVCDKYCVFGQKVYHNNNKSNIKTLAGVGD